VNPNTPIAQNIETLAREKNIDPTIIISAIEDAVVTASRKQFKTGEDLQARYNMDTGSVDLFAVKRVVEDVENDAIEISLAEVESMGIEGAESGDILEFPRSTEDLGRIAAQTAKQIIFQKVREAERNNIYDEYILRVGDIVHGYVKRFEGGRIIVDLGKVEAVLPRNQQSRVESFTQGERIRVVIHDVHRDTKGPQVEVSRTSPELLKRLFEMEVPEIYDGTVIIKAAVREPGDRAKIAVVSRERDVDPVGACVGMKGSRVQAIIRELRGEKIDIIEYSEDLVTFAQSALAPAKITRVSVHHGGDRPHLDVIVEDEQLSLAIGKRGQNVRLAAELLDCKIDIKSESDVKDEVADALARMLQGAFSQEAGPAVSLTDELDLTTVPGVGQKTAIDLNAAGFTTLQTLLDASSEDLQQVEGVGPKTAQAILNWAQERAAKVGVEGEPASQEVQVPAAAGGSTMNDQDFFAALSKALGESEQQAKQAEELALEAEADRSAEDDGSDPAGGGQA